MTMELNASNAWHLNIGILQVLSVKLARILYSMTMLLKNVSLALVKLPFGTVQYALHVQFKHQSGMVKIVNIAQQILITI
jgi:hypothetical protein